MRTITEDRNQHQIIRKDARNCFVESLSDAFDIGKAHLAFATYDLSRPAGQRQTNNIHVFVDIAELLELCRKLEGGELRWMLQNKKKTGDNTPLQQWMGGTSAEKLAKYGRSRPDGKSLSRTAQLLCGNKSEFLFVADSGPGETDQKGLIVPKFGKNPENHVSVSMTWDALSELLLLTKAHFQAWLSAWYSQQIRTERSSGGQPYPQPGRDKSDIATNQDEMPMF
jgi:hypothetical protein